MRRHLINFDLHRKSNQKITPNQSFTNVLIGIHCFQFHFVFVFILDQITAVPPMQGGRQNVSKYSGNGSIMSHCTMPSSDCPDILNRSFSSARYNNWHSTSGTHCTSVSNGCASMHQRMTPTHRQCPSNRCCYPNVCPTLSRIPSDSGHGRLHKSLSFAFQTPITRNDMYRSYHGTPSGYATTGRIRSR